MSTTSRLSCPGRPTNLPGHDDKCGDTELVLLPQRERVGTDRAACKAWNAKGCNSLEELVNGRLKRSGARGALLVSRETGVNIRVLISNTNEQPCFSHRSLLGSLILIDKHQIDDDDDAFWI